MTSVDVLDPAGKKSGSVDLPAEVFDVQVNVPLIHQVVVRPARCSATGVAQHQNAGGGPRWWTQAVQAEGNGPCPSRVYPGAAVHRRWHRARAIPA